MIPHYRIVLEITVKSYIMATDAAVTGVLSTALAGLHISLVKYSGDVESDISFIEFSNALLKYIDITGNKSPRKTVNDKGKRIRNPQYGLVEKEILRTHLIGPALLYFNQLPRKLSFEKCLKALRDRFQPLMDNHNRNRKLEIFKMIQGNDEDFFEYCSRVLDASRTLNIHKDMLISICVQGANSSVKADIKTLDPEVMKSWMGVPLSGEGETKL